MRYFLLSALLLTGLTAGAQAQPVLTAMQNGGSYAYDIAAGSIFVLRGTGLSDEGFVQAAGLPLETALAGVSIRFAPVGGGAALDALMIYNYNVGGVNQLAGLLPSGAAPGEYDVTVTRAGQTSGVLRVKVVARNPGIVTADSSGSGPAQATTANYELIRFAQGELAGYTLRPVYAGDAVVLWLTGLGADAQSDLAGGSSGDMTAAAEVEVLVNGVEVTPFYAGRASGLPGTDQVNFFVPADVAPACDVSIQVRAGGVLSNRVTIAVAKPGAAVCESAQFTAEELLTLSLGGNVRIGIFDVHNTLLESAFPGVDVPPTKTETFFGGVVDYTQNDVVAEGIALTPGQCTAWTRQAHPSEIQFGVVTYLGYDAGDAIQVSGPGIGQVSAGKLPDRPNEYFAQLNGVTSGAYTMKAPGGADVGSFEATANLPEFDWIGRTSTNSILRSGMTIEWVGGTPGWVNITGYGAKVISGDLATDYDNVIIEGTLFSCIADAAAGSMNIPATILSRLPVIDATSPIQGSLAVLAIPGPGRTTFQAPLTAGGSVRGLFGYSLGYTRLVTIQ
ncbi:MAG: hypothetical protein GC160_20795 [Acidobacteria bacterium]|nr:hypothetical protein [Acidobacteriota bacterium]